MTQPANDDGKPRCSGVAAVRDRRALRRQHEPQLRSQMAKAR